MDNSTVTCNGNQSEIYGTWYIIGYSDITGTKAIVHATLTDLVMKSVQKLW